eukprot:GEMP01013470.1.p1 GENE.GEMP01013470.1~~GEMP01013470.1.p1  ORF type:complete len:663 (+),score=156.04 GEMP01013470.1:477-2465(+)
MIALLCFAVAVGAEWRLPTNNCIVHFPRTHLSLLAQHYGGQRRDTLNTTWSASGDSLNICRDFCRAILQHNLSEYKKSSGDEKLDVNKRSEEISKYCAEDRCPSFKEQCRIVLLREVCRGPSDSDIDVSIDCFIQETPSLTHLSVREVRRAVRLAGMAAFDEEISRQHLACAKYHIHPSQCTFDGTYEIEAIVALDAWVKEKVQSECERLSVQSPKWMQPKLDCNCARDSRLCREELIVARKMRFEYHRTRFTELLIVLNENQAGQMKGHADSLWISQQIDNDVPLLHCPKEFFYDKFSPLLTSGEGVDLRCFDALAEEMCLSLDVDEGSWFAGRAQELISLIFGDDAGRLDIYDSDHLLLMGVRRRAKEKNEPAKDGEEDENEGEEKKKEKEEEEESSGGKRDEEKETTKEIRNEHLAEARWTLEQYERFTKALLRCHDDSFPFALRNIEAHGTLTMLNILITDLKAKGQVNDATTLLKEAFPEFVCNVVHDIVQTGQKSALRVQPLFPDKSAASWMLKISWYPVLSDPANWNRFFADEASDLGVLGRVAEKEFIEKLCVVYMIEPDTRYEPPGYVPASFEGDGTDSKSLFENHFDKHICSLQNVVSRQYAWRGILQYQIGPTTTTTTLAPPETTYVYYVQPTHGGTVAYSFFLVFLLLFI